MTNSFGFGIYTRLGEMGSCDNISPSAQSLHQTAFCQFGADHDAVVNYWSSKESFVSNL